MAVALAPDQAIFGNISLVRTGAGFIDDRQECIRSCRQYGLLATQMVSPTCNRHVEGRLWIVQLMALPGVAQ